MALEILVNTGSGNGLLPDGTKPLPEPMLTYHQLVPVAFIYDIIIRRFEDANHLDYYVPGDHDHDHEIRITSDLCSEVYQRV